MILTSKQRARRRLRIQRYLWPAVAVLSAASSAKSEGFRNATIGTYGLGRSGGRIAQVDDASAVQHNPANLVEVTNVEAQLTPSVIYINIDYQSPSGQTASTTHPWKVLPDMFFSAPLIDDRLVAGLGITVPYGLANQWSTSASGFRQGLPPGPLTYTSPWYSQLLTINANPSLALKVNDQLSIGAGLDVMWSDLEFRQFLSPSFPSFQVDAEGDGIGVGGNVGVTWHITDRQQIAAAFRSTMVVRYSGTTELENGPAIPESSFNSKITYPNIVSIGYGLDVTDTVRLETDFEWIDFSQFHSLPIGTGNNAVVPSENVAENWHNTFTAGIGGDWKFAEHWVLRGGYQFFESPVPNSTFSPTIPDSNQNVITIGVGWKGKHSSLEAAYGLDFYNDRHINNGAAYPYNGTYSFNVHLISLTYNYSF